MSVTAQLRDGLALAVALVRERNDDENVRIEDRADYDPFAGPGS